MHCRECEKFHANGNGLNAATCDAMLRDRRGKMYAMWAEQGWNRRQPNGPSCFERGYQHFDFDAALHGRGCERNWLEGVHERPSYRRVAPALLGFDETIYAFCSAESRLDEGPYYGDNSALAERCVRASENVLRVMGGWNMCVNLMWQTCAIKGLLHGQGSRQMRFSIAPAALDTHLFHNPPKGCVNGDCGNGYAVSDVYYTEVCVMSHICRNRDALFKLRVGELFECDFDEAAFLGLRNILGSGSG